MRELDDGLLWPDPIVQLNPAFEPGGTIDELVGRGLLHERCAQIFRADKSASTRSASRLPLHRHQARGDRGRSHRRELRAHDRHRLGQEPRLHRPDRRPRAAQRVGQGHPGDRRLPDERAREQPGGELEKFLSASAPGGTGPVTFRRYTGQESDEEREAILALPPDILLTNYVMLELILTRPYERPDRRRRARAALPRARRAAHLPRPAGRRRRAACPPRPRGVRGDRTSSASVPRRRSPGAGTLDEQRAEVARVASLLFGAEVEPDERDRRDAAAGDRPRRDSTIRRSSQRCGRDSMRDGADGARRVRGRSRSRAGSRRRSGSRTEPGTGRLRARGAAADQRAGRRGRRARRAHGRPARSARDAIRDDAHARATRCASRRHGFPVFAFRLHQFFSRGDTVYASLEPEDDRYLTTQEQQYVPATRARCCCRSRSAASAGRSTTRSEPSTRRRRRRPSSCRGALDDTTGDDDSDAGFLYASSDRPVAGRARDDARARARRLARAARRRRAGQGELPAVRAAPLSGSTPDGRVAEDGTARPLGAGAVPVLPALRRRARRRQPRDFGKLMTLGAGGRSSATTILGLAAIRSLRSDDDARSPTRASC